jgi:CubicO group peptidase (beta-lactamase class C family)
MLDALAQAACPAIVCEVGRASGPLWRDALGCLSYDSDAPACQATTVFDLASLTKVIATTSLVMQQVRAGTLQIDTPVQPWLPEWNDAAYTEVTWGHLLDHSSGLPAHLRDWEQAHDAASLRTTLLKVPLERPVGASSVYSDTGFMVLGCALERLVGASLDRQWDQLWSRNLPWLGYTPPRDTWDAIAPTEQDPWRGRVLQGEVHDERAAVMGGVAPHAGLFGAVDAVGLFASTVLQSFQSETWLADPTLMRAFAAKRGVAGSSRALGWDTMLPTSSCGTRLSPSAIGHTGFTGTSLWIDWERDLYVVILTNRVHPTRTNERFVPMRARIHDAVVVDLTEHQRGA